MTEVSSDTSLCLTPLREWLLIIACCNAIVLSIRSFSAAARFIITIRIYNGSLDYIASYPSPRK